MREKLKKQYLSLIYYQSRKNHTNGLRKKQLAIFMQLEKIMTAIKNLEEDPAMASAAIESYPPTIGALIEMGKELAARIERYQ